MYQAFQSVKLVKQVNGRKPYYYHVWMVGFGDELRVTVEYGVEGGAINKTTISSVSYVSAAITENTLEHELVGLVDMAKNHINKKLLAGYVVSSGEFNAQALNAQVVACYDSAFIASGQHGAVEILNRNLVGALSKSLRIAQAAIN